MGTFQKIKTFMYIEFKFVLGRRNTMAPDRNVRCIPMKKVALIPCYEPNEKLTELVCALNQEKFEIILVDDGSKGPCKAVFDTSKAYATLLSYDTNHGKGYALKTGLRYIEKNCGDCVVVTMDCDGQHRIKDAETLCRAVTRDEALFAIGSRVLPKDAPIKSRLGNSITRLVYRAITGTRVYDTQSGLRAFHSRRIPEFLEIAGERYEYEMNVLLYLAKHNLPVREYPMETIYFDRKNSISHFSPLADSVRIYLEIIKYTASSLASFLIDYLMYAALYLAFGGKLLIANYGARAISSVFNFFLNRQLVFRSQGRVWKDCVKYFGLVLVNITVNSLILAGLTKLGWNVYGAKVVVEIIMFIINYLVQHFFVFKTKAADGKEHYA